MTVTESEKPTISVRSPGEMIEAVPYLLGFQPTESLVLVGLGPKECAQVQVTVRVDLDIPEQQLPELVRALQRDNVGAVAVLFVTAEPEGKGLRRLADALTILLVEADITLSDVLIATDTHWWSMLCADHRCCPVGGTPRTEGARVAAELVFAGASAVASREDLDERFEPEPDLDGYTNALLEAEFRITKAVMNGRLKDVLKRDLALITAEIRRHRDDPDRRLTVAQVGRIAVALQDYTVRDEIWLGIDERSIEADRLLLQLARRLPPPYTASPLFLYGWAAWRAGNGALASMAAERALRAEPNYSAARLLEVAAQKGMDPRTTPVLRQPE